jgi:hypothetical protein
MPVPNISLIVLLVIYCPPAFSQKQYDILSTEVDVNGWYLNPKWATQLQSPSVLPNPFATGTFPVPARTQFMWEDKNAAKCPNTVFKKVPFPGHFNFAGATFEGTVAWGDRSGDDDDYNIHFFPVDKSSLSTVNPDHFNLEFDSDETIDRFHTKWWKDFRSAVDNNRSTAEQMINGKNAIAFGVLGLDCAHNCSSELHPLMALAIQVENTGVKDKWAIFVRNWGNEGYCSSGVEVLDPSITSFSFKIKHPGAASVTMVNSEFLCRGRGGAGPFVQLLPGEGALVSFGFPSPDERERINGTLELKWTDKPGTKVIIPKTNVIRSIPLDTAEKFESVWQQMMTPKQKIIYNKSKVKSAVVFDNSPLKKLEAVKLRKTLNNQKSIMLVRDKERDRKDSEERNAILKAFDGKPPKF